MAGAYRLDFWHILLVLLVLFILFGHRLPSVMRMIGRRVVDMRVNPYQSPHQLGRQKKPRRRDHYPYWLVAIDILMLIIVLAVLAAVFMPA